MAVVAIGGLDPPAARRVARTDQLPVGARKLFTIEDRRIAIFNLGGTL